jgi:hypothetical protein
MARGYFDSNEEQDDKSTADQGQSSDKSRAVETGGTGADNFGNDLMQGEDIGKGHQPSRPRPSALDADENN